MPLPTAMLTATDLGCGLVRFMVRCLVFGLAALLWFVCYRIACQLRGDCATVADVILVAEALGPVPRIIVYARNVGQQG